MSEYTVRPFEQTDVDAFLALYGQVFPGEHGHEWFDWKYDDNPYVDHVPMYVTEYDGKLVGARPFMAFEMAVDGDSHLALQPGDAMVHPNHRRNGLFSRMTEAAIERYSDGEPSFFFNFPNHRTLPGNLKLGWETVGPLPTYYRIQNPAAVARQQASSSVATVAGQAAKPLAIGYNSLRDTMARTDGPPVERYPGVPAERLAAIADEKPGRIHAVRDATFFEWRFENPDWDYVTYVTEAAGDAAAGIVGTATEAGTETTKLTDFFTSSSQVPDPLIRTVVSSVVEDFDDSDLLAAPDVVPQRILRESGFHVDEQPPLSYVADQTTHVVRSLTDSWRVNGLELTDRDNWSLSFAEQDTS